MSCPRIHLLLPFVHRGCGSLRPALRCSRVLPHILRFLPTKSRYAHTLSIRLPRRYIRCSHRIIWAWRRRYGHCVSSLHRIVKLGRIIWLVLVGGWGWWRNAIPRASIVQAAKVSMPVLGLHHSASRRGAGRWWDHDALARRHSRISHRRGRRQARHIHLRPNHGRRHGRRRWWRRQLERPRGIVARHMPRAALIHGQQQECGRDARFEEIDGSRGTIAAVAGRGR